MVSNYSGREHFKAQVAEKGLRLTQSNYIEWAKEHPHYPRNWSAARKIFDTTIIVLLEFYTTIISTTGPSAASSARKEYGIGRVVALLAFTFSYQMGQALGGLILPSYSESFGRRKPYLYSSAVYAVFSLITGVVPSIAGVSVGRFFSGFASAVPSVVIAGSIEDLYASKRRVWLILLWNSFTTLGLTIGPIYGSYIADTIGWRWIYYTSAIVTAFLFLLLLMVRESRPSKLLSQKFDELHKESGRNDLKLHDNPDSIPDAQTFVKVVLLRPLRLGCTEPIVILVSVLNATAWGLIYLFTESLTVVYGLFGWSETTASLSFIAIGVGIIFTILPRFWDLRVMKARRKQGEEVEPEDKIIGFAIAAPTLAIGLWLFSWTIPPHVHVHWVISMLGLVLIGFAANEFAYTLNGYLADSYTVYAGSGLATLAFLRALVSGVMPLFAFQMFSGLGSNVAGSILAGVATAFCITPFIFLRFGKPLRKRSKFARHSANVNRLHGND